MTLSTKFSLRNRIGWIFHVLIQQIIAIIVITVLWILIDNHFKANTIMFWHILCATSGFALFMAEGIILFSEDSVFTLSLNRVAKANIHKCVMGLAVLSICVGLGLESSSKDKHSADHFTSTHGKLGLAAWILTLIAACGGIVVTQAQALKQFIRPVYIKFVHGLIGISAFGCGIIALGYGFKKLNFPFGMLGDHHLTFMYVLLGILGFYGLIGPVRTGFYQIKNILSR